MTLPDTPRYRQRGAPIIHDTIDNETIAINQLTGAYYSLDGASALAWECLAHGATPRQIADQLCLTYNADPATIETAVDGFIRDLLDEQLIVIAEGPGNGASAGLVQPTSARNGFDGLRLQRYTDLEVMLLADPIHEVDDTGWPMPIAETRT